MEDHEAGVREDVRQCHTVGEHGKAEGHDRLARVRSLRRVARELVPLVVVDEDGRDIVVFVDQFDLWPAAHAAESCTGQQAVLVVCGFSLLLAARANCALSTRLR